jgi:hypothetical protein
MALYIVEGDALLARNRHRWEEDNKIDLKINRV